MTNYVELSATSQLCICPVLFRATETYYYDTPSCSSAALTFEDSDFTTFIQLAKFSAPGIHWNETQPQRFCVFNLCFRTIPWSSCYTMPKVISTEMSYSDRERRWRQHDSAATRWRRERNVQFHKRAQAAAGNWRRRRAKRFAFLCRPVIQRSGLLLDADQCSAVRHTVRKITTSEKISVK